jgi:hypothetical protein
VIKIESAPWLKLSERNFGVEVARDRLLVPPELSRGLKSIGVRSGEELASALTEFPSAFVAFTHFSDSQVMAASDRVLRMLLNSFPEEMKQAVKPSKGKFKFGALSPEILERLSDKEG